MTNSTPTPVNFEFDAPGRDLESLKRFILLSNQTLEKQKKSEPPKEIDFF